MSQPIPRRTLLKGVGAAMALPMLEAMLPSGAYAAAPAGGHPVRTAFFFVPNGMHIPDWTPATEGALTKLPYILEPLHKVKGSLNVLTGLTQDHARAHGDGGGDHARSTAAFLTGCQPRKTAGADIKVGISADQLMAQRIGHLTRFPSLEIGCERGAQAGNCDSGYSCAYSSSISWRSESTPVAKEVDPRLVFERLFSNGDAQQTAESRAKRDLYRKSILDFVLEDADRLKSQLGAHDQRKMDEYFTGIRELELRLDRAAKEGAVLVNGQARPNGIPPNYDEHIRLLGDMLVLAFQADLTRIATFMFANDGSNRSYKMIGIPEGHHDLSHHGRDPNKQARIRQINRFHIAQFAYFLEKLQSVKEGEGTLLDNSIILYGAGISDGDRHNHDNLPILMAGRGAGTIRSGRHIVYPNETPLNNLLLSVMERAGAQISSFGDSKGPLPNLS